MLIFQIEFFLRERNYKMQNQKEIAKVGHFLELVLPIAFQFIRFG